MFYIHPWELDDWVPELDAPRLQMIRTFYGRRGTWGTDGQDVFAVRVRPDQDRFAQMEGQS